MKITMSAYDTVVSYEVGCNDLTSVEVLQAVKGLMYGLTFAEDSIIDGMKEIIAEYEDMRNE